MQRCNPVHGVRIRPMGWMALMGPTIHLLLLAISISVCGGRTPFIEAAAFHSQSSNPPVSSSDHSMIESSIACTSFGMDAQTLSATTPPASAPESSFSSSSDATFRNLLPSSTTASAETKTAACAGRAPMSMSRQTSHISSISFDTSSSRYIAPSAAPSQMPNESPTVSTTNNKNSSSNNRNKNNKNDNNNDSRSGSGSDRYKQPTGRANKHLHRILERNRVWAERINIEDPDFLRLLTEPQQPKYLYIGCSDSRVSPSKKLDVRPGEVFVHRNIGNLVVDNDLSVLAVLEYSIDYLGVQDIIVAGHYGCGAIQAASTDKDYGVLERWLRQIRSTRRLHKRTLESLPLGNPRLKALTEMNVVEQCINVYKSAVVQRKRAQVEQELLKLHQTEKLSDDQSSEIYPRIHGVVFDPETGCLKEIESDLQLSTQEQQPPPPPEEQAQQHAGRGRD